MFETEEEKNKDEGKTDSLDRLYVSPSFLPLLVTGASKQNWKHVIRPNPASSEKCKTENVL